MNVEFLGSIHAPQRLESFHWHLRGASDELNQPSQIFLVHGLHQAPEPGNLWRLLGVARVLCVGSEVLHIDRRQSTPEQFELTAGEDRDQVRRHHGVETFLEGFHLVLDPLGHDLLSNKFDILVFVLVCNRNVTPVGLQVDGQHHPKLLADNAESLFQDIGDVVVEHPAQVSEVLRIDGFDVLVLDGLVQHVLVHRKSEVGIEELVVIQGFAHHQPCKLEVLQVIGLDRGCWVWLVCHPVRRMNEEHLVRVQHLL
mmetsp:Transcript_46977/g.73517  ORF Transcript_46977/g.73517 Transcript_46977/m.73517 type:complete len:255 (-) Transcript_46977:918-1682(-)